VFYYTLVVGYTVLVGFQWSGTGSNIGGWDDSDEILVRLKVFICNLVGIVQRLRDIREVRAE